MVRNNIFSNLKNNPAGLAADIAFVQGLETYVANVSKEGYKDVITERAPSSEAIKSTNIAFFFPWLIAI
jgi:hypothetical protein